MSSRCCTLSTSTWQSKKRQYCESIHQHLGLSRPATHNMITHRHLHIRTHTCAHAHTHTHCDRHKCTHTHKHMHDHTTHTTHTHNTTHTHTSTHTHTHTHTHSPPHPLPHHALPLVLCFAALCFCISWASFAVRKRCDVPVKLMKNWELRYSWLYSLFYFVSVLDLHENSPWTNCNGWLGVKHQVTYLHENV